MKANVTQLVAQYSKLDEFAIFELSNHRESLTSHAKTALDLVIQQRAINLSSVRAQLASEQTTADEQERLRQEAWRRKDAFWLKTFLVVGVPLVVLGLAFQPERTYVTLVSTIVQAVGIVALVWVVLRVRRALNGRRRPKP